jgi:hypothetical protein
MHKKMLKGAYRHSFFSEKIKDKAFQNIIKEINANGNNFFFLQKINS